MTVRARAILDKSRPLLQRKCDCGPKPSRNSTWSKCSNEDDRNILRRKSHSNREVGEVPPIVYDVLRSPGQPLDANTRAFFEPRFGHDFSGVRVHTDYRAAESADLLDASAYTVGRNITFGEGEYLPNSNQGQRLLAHELSHVVQQHGGTNGPLSRLRVSSDGFLENEANHAAEFVLSNSLGYRPHLVSPVIVSRQTTGKQKSRRSRPRNAPRRTMPIDESDLTREEIHSIKDLIGARPTDWVGVTTDGNIITTDEEGNAEEHGHTDHLLPGGSGEKRAILSDIPNWIWEAIVGAGLVSLVAGCFMSGVCAFVAVTAGLGTAAAASLVLFLNARGVRDDSQA